jgi:4-hydroxybenzoate polyprenyltransferase
MSKLGSYVILLRPQQYYKNILVFLGLIFSGKMFDTSLYYPLLLGFFALACISSISYIINDWKDIEADRKHPEKIKRPLASGKLNSFDAILLIILLVFAIITILIFIPIEQKSRNYLFLILLAIFLTSQAYSLFFKNHAIYDVIFISLNYVWRATTGVIIISVLLSPWLFFLGFLFAMFLAFAKRKADLFLLKGEAKHHKKVYNVYTNQILDYYIVIVSATIIVAYSIYVVESVINLTDLSKFQNPSVLLLTLPIVTLIILKLIYLEISGSEKLRKAELLFLDKEIILNGILMALLTVIALYWDDLGLNILYTYF